MRSRFIIALAVLSASHSAWGQTGGTINLYGKELEYAGLYCARISGQGTEVTVRALAPDGNLLAEQTLRM